MTVVPSDTYAERLVVVAMLDHLYDDLAGDSLPHLRVLHEVAGSGLRVADFLDRRCALAYAAILALREHGWPVSIHTVYRWCRKSTNVEHHIDADWLAGLDADLPTVYGVGWWASRIVEKAKERRKMAAGERIAEGGLTDEQAIALVEGAVGRVRPAETVLEPWPLIGAQQVG